MRTKCEPRRFYIGSKLLRHERVFLFWRDILFDASDAGGGCACQYIIDVVEEIDKDTLDFPFSSYPSNLPFFFFSFFFSFLLFLSTPSPIDSSVYTFILALSF